MTNNNIPDIHLQWNLYGAGLENFGDNGKPTATAIPEIKSNELLVRVDACGLCFSDTKVIRLGGEHPRLNGRDLKVDPAVLGHEAACVVVKAGSDVQDKYKVGDRYIVQADVFYKGVSMAFGYVFRGGLSQYQVIPHEMLDGDDGSYLLPIRETTGLAEAALVEPWACVVGAYGITYRNHIKNDGAMLIIHAGGEPSLAGLFDNAKPSVIAHMGLSDAVYDQLPEVEVLEIEGAVDWNEVKEDLTENKGFDDILLLGDVPADIVEEVAALLGYNGICCIARKSPLERPIRVDIGRVHYDRWLYTGTTKKDVADAYLNIRSAEVASGGKAWFVGAGGPMGQMHVQRAVQHPNPPKLIVATDVDSARLEECRSRYADVAESRGIQFVAINPTTMSKDEFESRLEELSGGGFDDVVVMAPIVPVIEQGAKWVGENGVMNVFAGAARGTIITTDMTKIYTKSAKFYGSSGSSIDDILTTLNQMEAGELQTRASLAAIGGMDAVKDGLQAVMEGKYPGKIVIFNQINELPLILLSELKDKYPTVYGKLENGKFWNNSAEEELLRLFNLNQ